MTSPWQNGIDFGPNEDFEKILTNPFLDIAARFWDKDRYEAFRVCYRSMRRIDDLVDERKISGPPLTEVEINGYREMIASWVKALVEGDTTNPFLSELLEVLNRFAIPKWPWERLGRAMIYDLEHHGFSSFPVFLRYAEGAAIAPASVFMHLCGVQIGSQGETRPGDFDIREVSRPLAIFSYLVHIMRDFQKDQREGLNYFADDFLAQRGLTPADLKRAAEEEILPDPLRDLMRQYLRLADYYRAKARMTLDRHRECFQPKYRLSLEIIYGLYHLVFERVNPELGLFTADELNPTPGEIEKRLQLIVTQYNNYPD